MARERRGFRAFSISVNREERIMAKHRVKKHRSTKKHHSHLKTVGGFKAMEHKKERRKR
jgi:hypothetical protein